MFSGRSWIGGSSIPHSAIAQRHQFAMPTHQVQPQPVPPDEHELVIGIAPSILESARAAGGALPNYAAPAAARNQSVLLVVEVVPLWQRRTSLQSAALR